MFVPHMEDRVKSFADAASAALQDRWVGRDVCDGSDASEDGAGGKLADYYHLSSRTRLPTTPGVVPVHLPPDPNVLASLQARERTSGAGHAVAGQEGNSPPAGQGAADSAQVDVGVSLPSQSAVRRARLAGAIHGDIGVAASACPDCRLDPRSHLRETAEGDDGWTADQVAFLGAGCGIVGEHQGLRWIKLS